MLSRERIRYEEENKTDDNSQIGDFSVTDYDKSSPQEPKSAVLNSKNPVLKLQQHQIFFQKDQVPDKRPSVIKSNVITKYAYATRAGFVPNYQKQNQDAFILSPNMNQTSF
jgi:hypothetical protein